ncbi:MULTISPECIES: HD domain-containing phosphohydrolase [unclassified Pseudodesulfovibrio]|uniref:HD-GYP domain-containing protein n=1 Tax=unclassified Pseudodesulfovibrio TaxID=2661612 RepID=UPI000FEBEA22|nr:MULTISPECIES: HD domain-containing phosphohydrolase [unclassified Pseudodesulfovibrio]MCJ2165675.1 HD domain-containing protein [Pseudodesulfovibrio sp. S3-i]RWU02940.1 HD domain-containing protein [Pseudodesulfovibrio sp. S3]
MSNIPSAGNGNISKTPSLDENLVKVSPYMVIPSRVGGFSLYLKQEGKLVLYAEKGELFTDEHKERLSLLGVKHLYVKGADYRHFMNYLQDNILELLDNESIPVTERARVWNDATVSIAREAFDRSLPSPIDKRQFKRIRAIISNSLKFLAREDALKELSRFIKEGDESYRHGIGVMVLTITTLCSFMKEDSETLVAVGMGAILHDIGKMELPQDLFTKKFDNLSRADKDLVKSHPALGVSLCSSMPLPQEALQCILFHHEREDGLGYPSGSTGAMLPSYVKVLSLCNEYDNLTRGKEGRRMTPFEALTHIKSMRNAYDKEMLRRLISVLAKADLT